MFSSLTGVYSSPNIKWDDVCGMNYAKQVLMEV